jgi:NACHT domain/Restriction endonuclease
MLDSPGIHLLSSSNNKRGDLFTRLMKDLFFALGYDNLRLDVAFSGREIDLLGEHRFEPRRVIGECKAHAKRIGGDQINKFLGVLSRERKKHGPLPVAGYFISLGGFTETAISQEEETGDDEVILLNAEQVVAELEKSRVVVSRTIAVGRAGQCLQYAGVEAATLDGIELLGHERGYVWVIYFAHGTLRTHFSLVHADGTPLAKTIAKEIIQADRARRGNLHSYQYMPPPPSEAFRSETASKALASYQRWLAEECGYIHLDGLPADTDLSAARLKLERLFVPIKCTLRSNPQSPGTRRGPEIIEPISSIGSLLREKTHLALLAPPGGGKSTLMKRLATAYGFPERLQELDDDLPNRNWLPLLLRCRELRDRAHYPILELLNFIPNQAGLTLHERTRFQEIVQERLREGSVLLLIDGLDEISDEGSRKVFASHLRTFVAMFPQVALVITSREAGFRLVGGVIASACEQAKLAALAEEDVQSLCERWHVEVVRDTETVRFEARQLGLAIWANERIRKLAENPLLLTTLLVVKRWIGELPRGRASLYREAIRVLVRTWNVEGFAPLDEDETLAQLSYVACAMMAQGTQQIGQKALLKLLQQARRELEPELQFARISTQEFIDRIESRSSLLMQTGHEVLDGQFQGLYEFRHLTFQEYLAARGYVEEHYPGRDEQTSLSALMRPHFDDERWTEVIPLTAVLAGRRAEDLMNALIDASEGISKRSDKATSGKIALYQCVLDEVQVTSTTLRRALREIGRTDDDEEANAEWFRGVCRGKFSQIFKDVVEEAFLSGGLHFDQYLDALFYLTIYEFGRHRNHGISIDPSNSLIDDLSSANRILRIRAALISMELANTHNTLEVTQRDVKKFFERLLEPLSMMLSIQDLPSTIAASWAIALIANKGLLVAPPEPSTILSLYGAWRHLDGKSAARFPAWAIASLPLLPRDTFATDDWGDYDFFLVQAIAQKAILPPEIVAAALVIGWYRRSPWNDAQLVTLCQDLITHTRAVGKAIPKLLKTLHHRNQQGLAES